MSVSELRGARTTKAPSHKLSRKEFVDFKLFQWDQLLFQLFNMTGEEEDAPGWLSVFSSSYVTQKWTYLGDLQKSKLTEIESVGNGRYHHCRTETQSSTDSGSSCGCCNWWRTINMLTRGALCALTHLAIINLSWEQLPTLCKPERETEEKTEHTCKNSVELCRERKNFKRGETQKGATVLNPLDCQKMGRIVIRDGVRALNLRLWPKCK